MAGIGDGPANDANDEWKFREIDRAMNAADQHDDTAQQFTALLRRREEELPLDHAAALIARGVAYPNLDVAAVLRQLDRLADSVRSRLPGRRNPQATIALLNRYLFTELGFHGNIDDYYDPCNSFLNDVLSRRTGIPIALSLVYLEIARRLNFPLTGVGLPGHFIVKYAGGGALANDLYIDPFHRGAQLTLEQLRQRVQASFGGVLPFQDHYLGAVTKKQILTRLLTNLKAFYLRHNDAARALAVVEYLLLIAPWNLEERRDRGVLTMHLGDISRALDDLQTYEQFATDATDVAAVRGYITALRRRFSLPG